MKTLRAENLRVKLFADGADTASMLKLAKDPLIKGFTTNPTLMRSSGVKDYATFSKELLSQITDKPISFEVLSDDLEEIKRQALKVSSWASNVYVKIPITNSRGEALAPLIGDLSHRGVKINVTAVFTLEQTLAACQALRNGAPSVVSVFAGRIADAGVDPIPHMQAALAICRATDPKIELLWASPRELLNIIQADQAGTDIITVLPDILKKLAGLGKDLNQFSLETVQMFKRDAESAGYQL